MAKAKSTRSARVAPQIIHENDVRTGMHRIVRVEDGKTVTGEWAQPGCIASLDGLRAATAQFAGELGVPSGVFRTSTVEHAAL